MKVRDLLVLIVKILGIYLAVMSLFSEWWSYYFLIYQKMDVASIFFAVGAVGVPVCLLILLVFKAENVVRFLKLDQGFSDVETTFFGSYSNLLTVGLIVVGGILIVNNLFTFIGQSIFYFKGVSLKFEFGPKDFYLLIASFGKLLVGYFLLTNSQSLAKKLENKTSVSDPEN